MPNEILVKQGTSLTWTSSGGTYAMDMSSLADGAGRAGTKGDLGATFAARYRMLVKLDFNVAPTAGVVVDLYWSSSHDNTVFDGECSGTDGAYNAEEDMRRLHYVGSLVCSNDTDPQYASFVFSPPARYGLPVISNQAGQALTATGTDQVIILTPLIDEVQ
jgi:hypothetical protein